jgi:hypothetical protein
MNENLWYSVVADIDLLSSIVTRARVAGKANDTRPANPFVFQMFFLNM